MANKKLRLVKRDESFKLIIDRELERKIRQLCKLSPSNEWSGTLFYKAEGSFDDGTLQLRAVDLFLQDLGTGGFTEFKNDENLPNYMVTNDLLDCYTGLVHSHHQMTTVMVKDGIGSGTDMSTLLEEGTDNNHFLSLIINNAGKYAAAITRHIKEQGTGTSTPTYNSFNDVLIEGTPEEFEYEDEYIEYWVLDIEVEQVVLEESPLEKRFRELKSSLQSYVNKIKTNSTFSPWKIPASTSPKDSSVEEVKDLFKDFNKQKEATSTPFEKETKEAKQLTLWEDDDDIPYGEVHVDEKLIESSVKQIISGNIFAGMNPKFDIESWIKNMKKIYDSRFNNDMQEFKYFADNFIDSLSSDCEQDEIAALGTDVAVCIWAYDVSEKLREFPKNEYLDYYITSVERNLL